MRQKKYRHKKHPQENSPEATFLKLCQIPAVSSCPKKRSVFQTIDEFRHKDFTFLEVFAEFLSIRIRNFTFEVWHVSLKDRQKLAFFLFSQMKSVHDMSPFIF
jgi:hypothetical protein